MSTETTERILRKPELFKKIGCSDATIWRWERKGKFPRRVQLGGNSVGWLASEVNKWIKDRAAEREVSR